MPGAVRQSPIATRDRLRAYHDRGSDGSARRGIRGAVVVDHTHLIVSKSIDSILIQAEDRVVDQKLPNLRLAEIEHEPAGMADLGEIERIAVPPLGLTRLAIEEIDAFVSEIAPRMVVNDIEQNSHAVQVEEVDERLELIDFGAQLSRIERGLPLLLQEDVDAIDVRRQPDVLLPEIHFRREVVGAVVAQAECGWKLDDRQQLNGRHSEIDEILELVDDVQERTRLGVPVRRKERADVHLVDDKLVEGRCAPAGCPPGEIG